LILHRLRPALPATRCRRLGGPIAADGVQSGGLQNPNNSNAKGSVSMTSAIQMLANMGSNAAASRMSADQYASAIAALGADEELGSALLNRDVTAISRSLGGRISMVCMVAPAEEEPPAQEDAPVPVDEPVQDA